MKKKKTKVKESTQKQKRTYYLAPKIEIEQTGKEKFLNFIYSFHFDKTFINLFIGLLLIESIFYVIAFGLADIYIFARIFLFILINSCLLALFINLIKNNEAKTIITFIILLFFGIYAVAELQFKNFLETYYSFISVAEGGLGRVRTLIVYFITSIKPYYFLCLLPLALFFFINKYYKETPKFNIVKKSFVLIVSVLLLFFLFSKGTVIDIKENYLTHNDIETTFKYYGLEHTFVRDIVAIKYRKQEKIEIIVEEQTEIIEEPEVKSRSIDDTYWNELIDKEDNKNILDIDNYLKSRPVYDFNDKTGIFENKNLIYIICESLDYMAIDKELTPSLYKLFNEGYSFTNHYTPVYTCGTGDSDMICLTSLLPIGSACTYNSLPNNSYGNTIANLFKNAGYDTYAYHNWTDEFYSRTVVYPNCGFDSYKDYNDLKIKTVLGWQSDSEMFSKAYDEFSKSEHYFTYLVTSTMHFPYDIDSYYGNLNVDKVSTVYPDYPIEIKRYLSKSMEFDKAVELLISRLKEDNKLDDTVIVFFPDHYPFKLTPEVVLEYGNKIVDRSSNVYDGKDKTPFVIYNSELEGEKFDNYCSTLDHVPTLANMFNLNFDPRLYIGVDIFTSDAYVIYNNGSFVNKNGYFDASSNKFVRYVKESEYSDSSIESAKAIVKNKQSASKAIFNNDYFNYRKELVDAKYLK